VRLVVLAAGFVVLAGEETWSLQDLVVVFLVAAGLAQLIFVAKALRHDSARRGTAVRAAFAAIAIVVGLGLTESWRSPALAAWIVGVAGLFALLWPAPDPDPV
jgi:hypothetical protein